MYCSNLKTKQTNRTVILAFKVGSLWGKFKSARCRLFARRRQALNNVWWSFMRKFTQITRRQSTLRKEKTEQKSNNQKKTNNFFDKNKTKNKEFVSLLI